MFTDSDHSEKVFSDLAMSDSKSSGYEKSIAAKHEEREGVETAKKEYTHLKTSSSNKMDEMKVNELAQADECEYSISSKDLRAKEKLTSSVDNVRAVRRDYLPIVFDDELAVEVGGKMSAAVNVRHVGPDGYEIPLVDLQYSASVANTVTSASNKPDTSRKYLELVPDNIMKP